MTFDDYEAKYERRYAEFASIVKYILEKAIEETSDVRRPQSIQCRAKAASHLKPKLQDRGLLDSAAIETAIKDLAGARLIFYTNADVDRFLSLGLITDNFEVQWDETKIHHPIEENAQQRYQAIHYTVLLKPERTALPEYAKFRGLRCEIQIQTILNHAWSETSHDILYKPPSSAGYGRKAMQSIEKRMMRIMDEYLIPAGYEFQKVQHDFHRLMQGKTLFDRGAIESLERCTNNNERHEFLSALKDQVLPNYDDSIAIYPELRRALLKVVNDANGTESQPIDTPFGKLPGKKSQDVTAISVDILDTLRYIDPVASFHALTDLYKSEHDASERQHILATMNRLAEYNRDAWHRVGPGVQVLLANEIERLGTDWRLEHRAPLLPVWRKLLSTEVSGVAFTAVDTVTLSRGSIPASAEVQKIREKSINGLIELLDHTSEDSERRAIITTLWEATRLPFQADYSADLCKLVLTDLKRIVEEFTGRISELPYDLLEHIEHELLNDFRQANAIAKSDDDRSGCIELGKGLVESILQFRNDLNADRQFVKYKTLVGFESVFPHNWDDPNFDISRDDLYRHQRMEEYVQAITSDTEEEWFGFIERCAATRSNDLATFPIFGAFITRLAELKPDVASRFLERGSENLLGFSPALLNGLYDSGKTEEYEKAIQKLLTEATHLTALGTHWSSRKPRTSFLVSALLDKAISIGDDIAVMQCVALAIKNDGAENQPPLAEFFVPALHHLTTKKDARWIHGAWYLSEARDFFTNLSAHHTEQVLDNLIWLPRIDFQAERLLACMAEKHSNLVWSFFGRRLKYEPEAEQQVRYEPFPYQLGELANQLAKHIDVAVATVRAWYRPGDPLFRFQGGRLLSLVFPGFSPEFAEALIRLIADGSPDDLRFTLSVLQNYQGESATHGVIKEIIARLPDDHPMLEEVEIALVNTGIVHGEFGLAEAFRAKKEEMASWLTDTKPRVGAFAERLMRNLELRIAAEQRSAEQSKAMRQREFDDRIA